MELNDREKEILKILIELYVKIAEPIGSRTLSKFGIDLSSATIRNVMLDLEEKGLLMQPHTSAGRVPTDLAYRYYIDELMVVEKINENKKNDILESLSLNSYNYSNIYNKIVKTTGVFSSQIGFVLNSDFSKMIFHYLNIVNFDKKKLFIIVLKNGIVKNIIFDLNSSVSNKEIQKFVNIVNENFSGLNINDLKKKILELKEIKQSIIDVFENLLMICEKENHELYLFGLRNMISKPEFVETGKTQSIVNLFEDEHILKEHILAISKDEKEGIKIGKENNDERFYDFSFIFSKFGINNCSGYVGIFGPKRMQYSYLVPFVDFISKQLNN